MNWNTVGVGVGVGVTEYGEKINRNKTKQEERKKS